MPKLIPFAARRDPGGDVAAGFRAAAARPRRGPAQPALEIRHPSLSWMDFVLPSLERVRITRFLSEQEEPGSDSSGKLDALNHRRSSWPRLIG